MEKKNGTTCVRKMDGNLTKIRIRAGKGKGACVSFADQENASTIMGLARCIALGSLRVVSVVTAGVKRPICHIASVPSSQKLDGPSPSNTQ